MRDHSHRKNDRSLRTDARGATAVEFAVVAPILCLLMLGACDYGFMLYRQMQVDAAAAAGTAYVIANASNPWSQNSVQTAAQTATSLGNSVTATATQTIGCLNTTTGALYASGNPACIANVTAGTYVTVATSYAFTPLVPLPYSGLVLPSTLTGKSNVRTQ